MQSNRPQHRDAAGPQPLLQRGLRTGTLAGSKLKRAAYWDFEDETFRLDIALDDVPLPQSISFAFLKGFAAGFRNAYRVRFGTF